MFKRGEVKRNNCGKNTGREEEEVRTGEKGRKRRRSGRSDADVHVRVMGTRR